MKRTIVLCSLLAACGATPPALPTVVETPQSEQKTNATLPPVVLDNPDAAWRYHLPVPSAPQPMQPMAIGEFRLTNGLRALVATRNEVPVVMVHVVWRWRGPPPEHRIAMAAVLLEGAAKQSKSLRQALQEVGTSVTVDSNFVSNQIIEFATPAANLEASLSALFDSLSRPLSPAENLETVRGYLRGYNEQGTRALQDRVFEALYPAGNPFHDLLRAAEPARVRLDEVARFRDAEMRPESMTICAAGNISRETLEPMLERVTKNFKPPVPAASSRQWPAHKMPPGVFLFESKPEDAGGVLVAPAPTNAASDAAAFAIATRLVSDLLNERRQNDTGGHSMRVNFTPGDAFLAIGFLGDATVVSSWMQVTLDTMGQVAGGSFSPDKLERARRNLARMSTEKAESLSMVAHSLSEAAAYDGDPNSIVKMHNGAISTTREEIVATARKWFGKKDVRIVAAGQTGALQHALENLEIRPTTVVESGKVKK